MIDLLGTLMPDEITAFQELTIAAICLLWGLDLIVMEHQNIQRFWPPPIHSFAWWLGAFLLLGDGILYAALGGVFIFNPGGVPAWYFIYVNIVTVVALGAFSRYAAPRQEGD